MKGTAALKEYRRKVQAGLIVPKKVRARPSAIKAIKNKCKECACVFIDNNIYYVNILKITRIIAQYELKS